MRKIAQEEFAAVVWANVIPTDGCWHWAGVLNGDGYGRIYLGGRHRLAHRVVYEMERGPIPGGLTIDHLCRNRGCVNPAHLEPVSHAENVLRGESFSAKNAKKSVCPSGHELSGGNVAYENGRRRCLVCRSEQLRAASKRYRARILEATCA